jgi:Fe-S cluster assembly scaffold protein SufB
VDLRGALRLAGLQWAEILSILRHPAPYSTSHQEYATAASGRSRASFSGNILIPVTGKHVEADMRNRNLLLSREAEVTTAPKLEISTDDVKCAHGATVSSVSPDQLYYLQSRGIGRDEAEEMIVRGFTEGTLARLPGAALKERMAARFEEQGRVMLWPPP